MMKIADQLFGVLFKPVGKASAAACGEGQRHAAPAAPDVAEHVARAASKRTGSGVVTLRPRWRFLLAAGGGEDRLKALI